MVPAHPQPVSGHPDQLRWIVPVGLLACAGPMATVPPPLDALLADGTLAGIATEPGAVLTRLGPGRCWPVDGPRVRTALHAALDHPAGWRPAVEAAAEAVDAALYAAARDLLAGAAGQFVRSHGGAIDLVDVHDGVVTVRLGGACHGCPAARVTLRQRLEHQLRRQFPSLRGVVERGPG